MTNRETKLVTLARVTMLTVAQSVALPTAISVAAEKVGMSEDSMIEAALNNAALGQYIASACRTAIS